MIGDDEHGEHPWLALGIAMALFAVLWGAVEMGLAAWERRQERDWAVVRQTVPVVGGHARVREGGWSIELALTPVPVRMMRDHGVTVRLTHRDRPVTNARLQLRLRVPAMPMIDVTAVMQPQADGSYRGKLVLPLCSTTRSDWVAQVRADSEGRQIGGGFTFPAYPPSFR